MTKRFLKTSYGLETADQTRDYYQDWAASYDDEITENGYATPARCAAALARHAPDLTKPLLDIGCGTGLSGIAFQKAGFTALDGNDLSPDMLAQAEARGIYRSLGLVDLNNPLDFAIGAYDYIAAVGVISVGHAPAHTIIDMLDKLLPGGLFVFSLNDPTLAEGSFTATLDKVLADEQAELCESHHDTHLPGFGMESTVIVLRKR